MANVGRTACRSPRRVPSCGIAPPIWDRSDQRRPTTFPRAQDRHLKPADQADSPPVWQLSQPNGRAVLALAGDWIARSGRIPEFPANAFSYLPPGGTISLDIANVPQWDSGLIEFLWDVKRGAKSSGLTIDSTTLPAAARPLLGLLPDHLPAPRPPPRRRLCPLDWIGGQAI